MPTHPTRRALPALLAAALASAVAPADAAGPAVPEGFEIRLVAAVPAVRFPSQVATAPDGTLFVAEDPMDQEGPYEADDGRILAFKEEGAEPTVFARDLRAVFGMAWHDGALYVMHMPRLTVFRDTDGDGEADQQKDLFTDLGPGPNALNDHIVSGLRFGVDGMLYISVGDKGVPGATRPEDGRKVQLQGGGVLRCRPDGTELEVFSSGTRNHLEPNLDARDALFTYDNTDDGDGWWTRVTHHVDGGYYGYPYDYHGRPDRMLPRMAEYGGGSPCGGVVYEEDAWPEPWRGRALWAEWGKRLVRAFDFEPDGATYKVADVAELVEPGDLGDFRPIDLALSHDGKTLYIADWGMGGWGSKTEKVGRVFALTYSGEVETRPRGSDSDPLDAQLGQLDHPSLNERMRAQAAIARLANTSKDEVLTAVTRRLADPETDPVAARHLVWTLDAISGATPAATMPLLETLRSPVADVRAQAARALGLRRVPIAAEGLIPLLRDPEPPVRLEAIVALGRIGAEEAVPGLLPILADADPFLSHSARVALRRIAAWGPTVAGLDSDDPKVRLGVLLTLERVYDDEAASALARFAADPARPADERAKAVAYLGQTDRKVEPWDGKWWGTRPTRGRFPARSVDWEGTPAVLAAVRSALADPEPAVRLAAVASARDSADPGALPALRERLAAEPDAGVRAEVAGALGALKDREALPALVAVLRDPSAPEAVRSAAIGAVEAIGGEESVAALVELLDAGEAGLDPARRPGVIAALGRSKSDAALPALLRAAGDPDAASRAAAAPALVAFGPRPGVADAVRLLLGDPDLDARKAGIAASADLKDDKAIVPLLALADDPATRFEAARALAALPDPRALRVYLRGLADVNPDLRRASGLAIAEIREAAAPMLEQLAARKELPSTILPELRKAFGRTRPVMAWQVVGPFPARQRFPFPLDKPVDTSAPVVGPEEQEFAWRAIEAVDEQGQVDLGRAFGGDDRSAFAYAEVTSPSARSAQLVVGSDDTLMVFLNGRPAYRFNESRGWSPEQDRVDVELAAGVNRLVVRSGNRGGGWQFSVALTEPADYAFLQGPSPGAFDPEAFRAFALKSPGDPARGEALFADVNGLACLKCHVVAGKGGAVGPDLSGVAAKYGRDELIASVLYPSEKIFSGYETEVVATADGRVISGILKAETPEALELDDADAKRVRIPIDDVEERKRSDVSLMPSGLAEGLTPEAFADLVAYLETLREEKPADDGDR